MGIYTGYFDEANDEHQPFFVVGGIALDADRVDEFDSEWCEVIKPLPQKDPKPYFHTTDFVSGNGVYFPEWKGRYDEKLAILTAMAKIIYRHSYQTFTCVLDMDDYATIDGVVKYSEAVGHPYPLACRISYVQLQDWRQRNSIEAPVKMIAEERQGFGSVIELFQKDELPLPSPESKAVPALQAADYISWMRAKKLIPTSSYVNVKDSWNEINKALHSDRVCSMEDYLYFGKKIIEANNDQKFPDREHKQHEVVFTTSPNKPRSRFERKPSA